MKERNRQGSATRVAPRASPDFWETPQDATISLLAYEQFNGGIWEPACGNGAISRVLERMGNQVYSTDLNHYGYGHGRVDFLLPDNTDHHCANIVTNPPYNLVNEFILKAVNYPAIGKVALLLRLNHAEGETRFKDVFKEFRPTKVLVFPWRLKFWNERKGEMDSFKYPHAWFVWQAPHCVKTEFDWIDLKFKDAKL